MHDLYYPIGGGRVIAMRDEERQLSAACTQFIDEVSSPSVTILEDETNETVLSGIRIKKLFEAIRSERPASLLHFDESGVINTYTERHNLVSGKIGEVLARSDLVGHDTPRMRPVWVGRIAAQEPEYETTVTPNGVYVGMTLSLRDVYSGAPHAELKYFGNRASVSEPHDIDITAYGFVVSPTGLLPKRNYWPQLSVGWDAIDKISMNGMNLKTDREHYVAARRFVKRTYAANPLILNADKQ